jgi:PEGA domain
MAKLQSRIKTLRGSNCEVGALLLVLFVVPVCSRGQAGVETAGADSSSAGVATALSKTLHKSLPQPEVDNRSVSIPARQGIPLDEANRRILEQRAADDAAKVLLQSLPGEAMIYIDGMFVGRTPLLLIVAPGKYHVEMRGPRQEFGERIIDLSPNETQQVALTLALRYPSSISLQAGRSSPVAGVATSGTRALPGSSKPRAGTDSDAASRAVLNSPAADEINRKALEQRAGPDAAKLSLESMPSEALTYLDGIFVGRTPLLLVVPPGKYKVEMRGKQEAFGERLVGLLPNETQNLALNLESRYPARIPAR